MLVAIFILLLLPFLDTSTVRSAIFKPFHYVSFIFFSGVAGLLG